MAFTRAMALKPTGDQNIMTKNYLGQGYHGTIVPACVMRSLFENPAW